MKSHKSRRNRFRMNGGRGYRRDNHDRHSSHVQGSFSNGQHRHNSIRNNHNPSKMIEKYMNLAKEALSRGDKILSENYFQHADHFSRIISNENLNNSQKKVSSEVKTQEIANSLNDSSETKEESNSAKKE